MEEGSDILSEFSRALASPAKGAKVPAAGVESMGLRLVCIEKEHGAVVVSCERKTSHFKIRENIGIDR